MLALEESKVRRTRESIAFGGIGVASPEAGVHEDCEALGLGEPGVDAEGGAAVV